MRNAPEVTLDTENGDGEVVTLKVPSQRVARLMQLGLHAERKVERRKMRRRMQKAARRRNRG